MDILANLLLSNLLSRLVRVPELDVFTFVHLELHQIFDWISHLGHPDDSNGDASIF